jgi:serine-type D-Ala-D-Ala carboxypeptidase
MMGRGRTGQQRVRIAVVAALAAAVVAFALLRPAARALHHSGSAVVAEAAVLPPLDPEVLVGAGVGVAYPGAALATGRGARIDRVVALGRIGWRDASPVVVAEETQYDLASLTKAMATTIAVLLLVEDGVIELDEPVRKHLPAFEGRWKDAVTWRHLLTHTSGLPEGAAVRGGTPAERQRRLLRTLLGTPPGQTMTYSDIGYIVLWAAVQAAAGEPVPRLLERRVWQPLGMTATSFGPGRDCESCAPTLRLRTGEPFRGESSDPIARQLGGGSGHAGLFSTARDMARFAAMIAGGGELDGVRILDAALVAELFRQQPGAGRRTLGWTTFCPDEEPRARVPCERPVAWGHTGWTGTSIWIEPESGWWTVLLTNRSYERTHRPFPLEALRRDLFLLVAGVETRPLPERWIAAGRGEAAPTLPAVAEEPPPP